MTRNNCGASKVNEPNKHCAGCQEARRIVNIHVHHYLKQKSTPS